MDEKFGTLVDKENIKELKQKLGEMIINPQKSLNNAENLKKILEQKFSLKQMIRQTLSLYNRLK